ncbi:bifunctional proline dehydrogenase/L-glutamate gamma-semialdehyde dehydrogenase PutA [Swingsia samuiensis]|uniref:Bifunctional protein PutA n=1 Tax=Swingsia samuiensis TaxID=1293412 RepID=A0A4Y6UHJ2_9PROT|nr:bifunctional proline dehydrogenase/L-glutamate gamma-semialdehyde dehydrogenase PutA [Swingsia samuiensis]QDH17043.1 bifunctional proline dehydrogenase/L-glutamate gamma-semialdehyde dehydrogenase PutA [Swingsia samuiensis]
MQQLTTPPSSSFKFSFSQAPQSELREAIADTHFRSEKVCIEDLLPYARLNSEQNKQTERFARIILEAKQKTPLNNLEQLLKTFPLSSPEGQSFISLAETFLRIPDATTKDALIRSQFNKTNWARHIKKQNQSLANSFALNMSLMGQLKASKGFSLQRLTLQTSTPMIRKGLEKTLLAAAQSFIIGNHLPAAFKTIKSYEKHNFNYIYDLQAETALTADQAFKALTSYENALETLGQHAGITGSLYERPFLYVRLPALITHFGRFRRDRLINELLPALQRLANRSKQLDIGLIFSVENSQHLESTLDLFESLCSTPELQNWNGLGITLNAYDKRAHKTIDFLTDLADRTARKIIVRLTHGSSWNSEIRQAQQSGLIDFPIFTHRCHTDISYLACAQKLITSPHLYTQFATENPRIIGHILTVAGKPSPEKYEFSFPYAAGLAWPQKFKDLFQSSCRIHAPIGAAQAWLPRFVRQTLEANILSPFTQEEDHNPNVTTIETLTENPIAAADAIPEEENVTPSVVLPSDLFMPAYKNSIGLDFTTEHALRNFEDSLQALPSFFHATSLTYRQKNSSNSSRIIYNPADHQEPLGEVIEADGAVLLHAIKSAEEALPEWGQTTPALRGEMLKKAADLFEEHSNEFIALLIKEAGKTILSAQQEVRQAVNFLRYNASSLNNQPFHKNMYPLGLIACISPWSSPLAAFIHQISISLAAGNIVIAKPAEQVPFSAYKAIQLLYAAGVPENVLYLLLGNETVGERLVSDPRIDAVMFTGSTQTGKTISRHTFNRQGRTGSPTIFVARTGGQNALLVDSSTHPEQAVQDILKSAFTNAGQHCSSLRILLIQEECADQIITLLKKAIQDLIIGDPSRLQTDIGPIISNEARTEIIDHLDMMRRAGRSVWSPELDENCRYGCFLPPTLIEIGRVADIPNEVFGPVLHIRRFSRQEFDGVIDAVNSMGFALSFGIHSRIPSTIERAINRIEADNIYINRNMIDTLPHAQPFGGHGMSGCGAKAGGPFALRRMIAGPPPLPWIKLEHVTQGNVSRAAQNLVTFLESRDAVSARQIRQDIAHTLLNWKMALPSPSGETNTLTLIPAGPILCAGNNWPQILRAVGLALGTGNNVQVLGPDHALEWIRLLPKSLTDRIERIYPGALPECSIMIMERNSQYALEAAATLTAREGKIVPIHMLDALRPEWLLNERVITTNTASLCGDPVAMSLS